MSLVQTTTPLGAARSFVSGVQQIPRANNITGSIYSDQGGTLTIQQGGEILSLVGPAGLAVAPVATGGTFAANTYYWVITALNTNGETIKSNEVSAAIALNGQATLTWTALAGATGYNIYRGIATGGETYVATVGLVTTYADTGAAASGILPPTTGTAYVWDANNIVTVAGGVGQGFSFPLLSPFFQVRYVNGAIPQTVLRLFVDARDPYGQFIQAPGAPSPGGSYIVLYYDPNALAYKVVNRFDGADGLDANGQAAIFQNTSGKYASFLVSASTVSNETIQPTSNHLPTNF